MENGRLHKNRTETTKIDSASNARGDNKTAKTRYIIFPELISILLHTKI